MDEKLLTEATFLKWVQEKIKCVPDDAILKAYKMRSSHGDEYVGADLNVVTCTRSTEEAIARLYEHVMNNSKSHKPVSILAPIINNIIYNHEKQSDEEVITVDEFCEQVVHDIFDNQNEDLYIEEMNII